jgi:hypothetical protein
MFKDKYCDEKKSYSFQSPLPDVKKLSSKAQKFFHKEIAWQDERFSEAMEKKAINNGDLEGYNILSKS